MDIFDKTLAIVCLVFGFGFVVFFHELGHFLAAKWVGIKVEQFAVGFGHAVASWRKGMGFCWGASNKRLAQLQESGADISQYGDTEYRLNWLPLGGYVKMLGQDDMNPNAQVEDPRAYNRKSIGARMLVVSAGVIMNVILAALLFMVVFLIGYHIPPPTVGMVLPNSPAQAAGLMVGDRVVEFDGQNQHAFTQLQLNIALVRAGKTIPVKVQRDGRFLDLTIRPQRPDGESSSFYALGIGPAFDLCGIRLKGSAKDAKLDAITWNRTTDVLPGETILAIEGKLVGLTDDAVLDAAVQRSGGKPLELTVRDTAGQTRTVLSHITFQKFFGEIPFNLVGLQPRPVIEVVTDLSPFKNDLHPGDIVTGIYVNNDAAMNPSDEELIRQIVKAGKDGSKVKLAIQRDGKPLTTPEVVPNVRIGPSRYGLGVQLDLSTEPPITATVLNGSAAAKAGVPKGALIVKVNGQEVANWFQLHGALKASPAATVIEYVEADHNGQMPAGPIKSTTLNLAETDRQTLANIRYAHELLLADRNEILKTHNPIIAAGWGVVETRDLLLQFYVTLHRLTQGSVSATNFMGPLGIVHAGSFFAFRGWDWLIWFLAMISANLAVVNFLPIPIVDGGLFVFLLIEKISGRPLSSRMQTVSQMVGLAIILSVFLLVTYEDIRRLFL